MLLALIFGATAGACGFRLRGGWATDRWPRVPGQAQRLGYAAIMAAVMLLAGMPWPVEGWRLGLFALALLAAWFAGAVMLGTLGSIDAGRVDGRAATDFWRNALRGCLYAALPAAVLAAFRAAHGDPDGARWAALMVATGACQGIAYEAAWRLRTMEQRPTELGEMLTGAALGAGAALACALA